VGIHDEFFLPVGRKNNAEIGSVDGSRIDLCNRLSTDGTTQQYEKKNPGFTYCVHEYIVKL
jgi:hypothetical protein